MGKLLVSYLEVFTFSKTVNLLEKMEKYEDAVRLLRILLCQSGCYEQRGFWYERLVTDLWFWLKEPKEALGNHICTLKFGHFGLLLPIFR